MATVSQNRKLAVITGASSGIGFALAEQCLENGFDVLICSDTENISDVRARLQREGASVSEVQEDLSTPEGVERLYQQIVQTGRPVDALLLNAGVGLGGSFLETDLSRELRMIALNCGHTVQLAKRVVSDMVSSGSGRVMITGSLASTAPAPFQAVYGATKAFVMSFGMALREELEGTGVTVTTLQPGATDTAFFERAGLEDTRVGQAEKDDPAKVAKEGFEAMLAGKASVVAGSLQSKAQGAMNEVVPETVKAMAREARPGSGKHRR